MLFTCVIHFTLVRFYIFEHLIELLEPPQLKKGTFHFTYIYISFILSISLNSSFYLEMAISQELGLPQMMVLLEKMFCEQDTMSDKDCNEKIIVDNICE